MFAHIKQAAAGLLMAMSIVIIGLSGAQTAQAQEKASRVPGPQYTLPKMDDKCVHDPEGFAKTGKCEKDTAFMRRNHMKLLLHKRDMTMHKGIRTKTDSLQNCINCHVTKDASGKPLKVTNPKHFCAACHRFAAVKLDCFECHRSTPYKAEGAAQIPNIPAHARILASNQSFNTSNDAQKIGKFLQEVVK